MQKLKRPNKSIRAVSQKDHFVHFYEDDKHLYKNLSHYILDGLDNDETCVVVAVPQTIVQINKAIRLSGIDISKVIDSGQYITLDAEELLRTIMTNCRIDYAKFMLNVGEPMKVVLSRRARPIRAHGEMVDILLEKGNIEAVKQLDAYWNNLADKVSFSLYCSHPEKLFKSTEVYQDDLISDLAYLHNEPFNAT